MKKPRQKWLSASALLVGVGSFAFGLSTAQQSPTLTATHAQITFFETKIRPVLSEKCYQCHGEKRQMADLRLDSREGLIKSGFLNLTAPEKSQFLEAIHYNGDVKMPPKEKLPDTIIADFEQWVAMGAPWPDEESAAKSKTDLWSLQPVANPPIPKVKNTAWIKNPIDAFILANLETKNQSPAKEADKRTLLRRLSYDLIGLPPTEAEVQAFVADKDSKAYEKQVDRLLASPRYGERWARHWLDVARYADTKGYMFEEDRNYYNAYTYRGWVIDAFNKDVPYDDFIQEQLAADRLPKNHGDDKSNLAALGFLTIGRRFLNSTPDIIDDRIDVTMRGFQGLTVACARCHDHKFDPIPTQDYYSLYAVFASSQEAAIPISEKSIREPWQAYEQRVGEAQEAVRSLVRVEIARLRKPEVKATLKPETMQTLQNLREEVVPEGAVLDKLKPSFDANKQMELAQRQVHLEEVTKGAPPKPEFAMAMLDKQDPSDGVIFKRGNPGNRGDVAPRRFLLALANGKERDHWTTDSGRLELAKSITSRENPLTARVFVNRVWQDHFGAGIVRTPSDFGHQGEPPTNPALLDFLAFRFMENGWSIKQLHRLIVTSATYRQSSNASAAMVEQDPDNRDLGRMNRHRLDLEQMRDSLLMVSGQLQTKETGGKSVDLWSQPFATKRAVYGYIERQNLPGIFRTFDFASPDSTSPRRFMTTVPQQALFFMNSPLVIQQAESLANSAAILNSKDSAQQVRRLYQAIFQRLPDATELKIGQDYLNRAQPKPIDPIWQYGTAATDGKTLSSFQPLSSFSEVGYHAGKDFPDPSLGYADLNQVGGHPGNNNGQSVVRRWVSPIDGLVQIQGNLKHGQEQGNGVHATIFLNSQATLGSWTVHHTEVPTIVANVAVKKGDVIDFVIDPIGDPNSDSFEWSPVVRSTEFNRTWDSARQFGPPPPPPLTRLTLYIQSLMMTNEFMFID